MRWNPEKFIGIDFETSGTKPEYALQPWRLKRGDAWITSVSAIRTKPEFTKVSQIMPSKDLIAAILQDAIERKATMVAWNGVFDIGWTLALGLHELVYALRWLDGMLLWKHATIEPEYDTDRGKKKSYGLKECVAELWPDIAGYEEGVDFHDPSPAARAKLQAYNDQDTLYALMATEHWYEKLEPQQLRAALIEAQSLPMIAEANLEGMVVDTLAAHELQVHLKVEAAKALEILAPHGVTEKVVRSPLQLARLLYDQWGLPVLKENTGKKTGTVSRSTDKEVLHELAFIDERAKTLQEYRSNLTSEVKFAQNPLDSVDYNEDDRTHPQGIPFGTYTRRLTYSSAQYDRYSKPMRTLQTGFALHQEKRGKAFRDIIVPPPGYALIEIDASGQEFRWMAVASGDPTMLQLCLPGEDPHSYMGAQIAQCDYRDLQERSKVKGSLGADQRQLGKVGNLSCQFRTSGRTLRKVARVQYNLPMELPEAEYIVSTYKQTYTEVPRYWNIQIALTKKRGWVETMDGSRVQVVGNWEGQDSWRMGSTAINYRIQGTGAAQKFLAMAMLRPYLRKIGGRFAWDLHDGIYMYIPIPQVERVVRELPPKLLALPYQQAWGFTPPVPMPWDLKVGYAWGSLQEVKAA